MRSKRPTLEEYMMAIARVVSTRGTCDRLHASMVTFDPVTKRILTTGYGGSKQGEPHCEDVGCEMRDGHCVRTNHGEENAVRQADLYGVDLKGKHAVSLVLPCGNRCMDPMVNAGLAQVTYGGKYHRQKEVESTHAQEYESALKKAEAAGVSFHEFEGDDLYPLLIAVYDIMRERGIDDEALLGELKKVKTNVTHRVVKPV
ncbi:MAG: hypothetical protein Q7R73_01735 [bacterium]|nr:hypothetical protein [bacterium]